MEEFTKTDKDGRLFIFTPSVDFTGIICGYSCRIIDTKWQERELKEAIARVDMLRKELHFSKEMIAKENKPTTQ